MIGRSWFAAVVFAALAASSSASAQEPPRAAPAASAAVQEEGIPIDNALVRSKCGACHRTDDKGRMSRISYRRATPENWERTIKRMATLNHVQIEPAEARTILKYLSDRLGLAPEEARPIAFEAERRTIEYTYTADKETSDTCSSCHSMSRVLSERRTKQEWELLVAMHRGYYPLVDMQPMNGGQGFRRTRPVETEPGPDGRPPDNRNPMDKAIEHLAKTLPLTTSEWSMWAAAMSSPRLAGRWILTGTLPGNGAVYGQVTVTADPSAPDSFSTETKYTIARTGETVSSTGKSIVYTGYEWRGRSTVGADTWREAMFVERGWKEMWGRWYTGAYDEKGIDVRLTRASSDPVIFGASVSSVRTASTVQSIIIYGLNLPASPNAADVSLGQGVKVVRVASASPEQITVDLEVAANAPIGARDLAVGAAVKPAAIVVYDRIDAIRIVPQAGMARVGGVVFPKQLQQFEAVGYNFGPDGKPDTADDLNLGFVPVKWSLDEYAATFDDDDVRFVGAIDQNGLFTPNVDGPNPNRPGNRNNIGDVWVVGELTSSDAREAGRPLRARAHLLVTVPLYMNWFAEEPHK